MNSSHSAAQPIIRSPELLDAIKINSEVFQEKILSIDAISDDIRALEQYFRENQIEREVFIEVKLEVSDCPDEGALIPRPFVGWMRTPSGQFRLAIFQFTPAAKKTYRVVIRSQIYKVPPVFEDSDFEFFRPLIEAKVDQRRRGHRNLPILVSCIAETVRFTGKQPL